MHSMTAMTALLAMQSLHAASEQLPRDLDQRQRDDPQRDAARARVARLGLADGAAPSPRRSAGRSRPWRRSRATAARCGRQDPAPGGPATAARWRRRAASASRPRGPRLPAIQWPTTGSDGLPHVEGRIERARHALDHDHGLLQQDQFGPRLHVEQLGDLEQQRQQLGHRDGLGRLAVDRLADGADRLGEGGDIVLCAARSRPRNALRRRAGSRGVMKP